MIFQNAARAGCEPWHYTFGELRTMAEARESAEWTRMSWLLAKLHNVHAAKRHMKKPEHFNPTLRKNKPKKLDKQQSKEMLKLAFLKG